MSASKPALTWAGSAQVDHDQENLDPALWMTARGEAGYIEEDGSARDESLLLYASITPEEDGVTIEYQPTPGSD